MKSFLINYDFFDTLCDGARFPYTCKLKYSYWASNFLLNIAVPMFKNPKVKASKANKSTKLHKTANSKNIFSTSSSNFTARFNTSSGRPRKTNTYWWRIFVPRSQSKMASKPWNHLPAGSDGIRMRSSIVERNYSLISHGWKWICSQSKVIRFTREQYVALVFPAGKAQRLQASSPERQ